MIVFVLRFPETDSAACEQQPVLGHAVRGGQDGAHAERLQQQPLPAVAAPQHDPERLIPHPTSSLRHFHLDQPWLCAPSPGGSSCTSHASPLCQTGQRLRIRAADDFPPLSQASLCAARHKFPGCSNYVSGGGGGGDGCAYGDLSVQAEWRVASAHGQHCNQSRHRWASCSPPCPLCRSVCCLAGGQMIKQKFIPNCWKVFLCSSLYCKWPRFYFGWYKECAGFTPKEQSKLLWRLLLALFPYQRLIFG